MPTLPCPTPSNPPPRKSLLSLNITVTIYVCCAHRLAKYELIRTFLGPSADEEGVEGFEESFKNLGQSVVLYFANRRPLSETGLSSPLAAY